jgi:hypothetical protein
MLLHSHDAHKNGTGEEPSLLYAFTALRWLALPERSRGASSPYLEGIGVSAPHILR